MKTATCTAVGRGDRIQLVIDNGEPGSKAFARVLKLATDRGLATWRGDITDENGKERIGYIVTCKPNAERLPPQRSGGRQDALVGASVSGGGNAP